MNKEKKKQNIIGVKLILIIVCAFLYAWGGIEHKWLRRFVAPAILCFSMFGFTRDWRTLIQMPFMFASLSMGYGATQFIWKIVRRSLFGLANGVSSSGYNIIKGAWDKKKKVFLLVGFQVLLLVSAYIVFGVFNPFQSARAEETILGLLVFAIPLLSAERS